jgi:HEAT repeat protein
MSILRSPDFDKLSASSDVRALTKLLRHNDPTVRSRAAELLGIMTYPERKPRPAASRSDWDRALIGLAAALHDHDAEVRDRAADAIQEIAGHMDGPVGARVIPGLVDAFTGADPKLHFRIASAVLTLAEQPMESSASEALANALAPALSAPERSTRELAARALGRKREYDADPQDSVPAPDPSALDGLLEALEDPDADTAADAAKLLSLLRDRRATEPLARALERPDEACLWAARALGNLGDPRGAITMADGDAFRRLAYVDFARVADVARAESVSARRIAALEFVELCPLLGLDADLIQSVAEAFSELHAERARPGFLTDEIPATDRFRAIEDAIADASVDRLLGSAPPYLADAIRSSWLSESRETGVIRAYGIGNIALQGEDVVRRATDLVLELLTELATDDDFEVRVSAVRALGVCPHERAVGHLIHALQDPEIDVRLIAVQALGNRGVAEAAAELVTMLGDPDVQVRSGAAAALGKLEQAITIDPLIRALRGDEPVVRANAALSLGKLGDRLAVDPLVRALDDADGKVREGAALALGELRDARAVEPLNRALHDPYEVSIVNSVGVFVGSRYPVRDAATQSLAAIGDAQAE